MINHFERYSVHKFELVELYIPATSTTQQSFQLQQQQQLQGAVIDFIEAYVVEGVSKAPSGKNLVTTAILKKSFITLEISDLDNTRGGSFGNYINQIPLSALCRMLTAAGTPKVDDMLYFDGAKINWNKCVVQTADAIGTGDISYLFGVYYRSTRDQQNQPSR